jgi:hypothetical protein
MINIKRISDGTDTAGAFVDEEDALLATDTSKTDTSYPILPEGIMDMEIVSVTKVEAKLKEGQTKPGKNLEIKMKTTVAKIPYGGQGDEIQAGFPVTTYISLTESEKYTKSGIEKSLASFTQSIDRTAAGVLPLDQWAGRMAQVKVSYKKESGGFPPGNNFRFVPLKATS